MDHALAALKSLGAAENAHGDYMSTGETATVDALQAIAHALLDAAAAIRDQTKTLDSELPDIRIALQEIQRRG